MRLLWYRQTVVKHPKPGNRPGNAAARGSNHRFQKRAIFNTVAQISQEKQELSRSGENKISDYAYFPVTGFL